MELFSHIRVDNAAKKTIVLFHGTGGDEKDLLIFNDELRDLYNFIGLRGNVTEHGMNRFFIRDESGVFDQDNIKIEADKLYAFTNHLIENNGILRENIFFLGYSNGANIILASIFYHPDIVQHAVLLHPMLPFAPKTELLDLKRLSCFVSLGVSDEIVSFKDSVAVISGLKSCGADVTIKEYPSGHQITREEFRDVVDFCRKQT